MWVSPCLLFLRTAPEPTAEHPFIGVKLLVALVHSLTQERLFADLGKKADPTLILVSPSLSPFPNLTPVLRVLKGLLRGAAEAQTASHRPENKPGCQEASQRPQPSTQLSIPGAGLTHCPGALERLHYCGQQEPSTGPPMKGKSSKLGTSPLPFLLLAPRRGAWPLVMTWEVASLILTPRKPPVKG